MQSKRHILIVDDSLTVRMDLRAALSEAGFKVTACDTLAWAERALRLHAFAGIILDVVLPDGSGIDLLRRIRTDPDLAPLPIILLSTRAEVQSRIEGLSTGADEYVGKPYDRDYLIQRVRQMVDAPAPAAGAARGRKLLVVDDSPTFLELLATQLRGDGHEVILASSGREALEYLEVESVDCVLLDLIMEELDGAEVCHRIRRIPGREETTVLLMTATDDPALLSRAQAAHADAVAFKLPGLDMIRDELRRLLWRRSIPPGLEPEHQAVASAPSSSRREHTQLFEQVMAASGLASVIARGAIRRACHRAGVDPATLDPAALQRVLPSIEGVLLTFLDPSEVRPRIRAIAAVARLSARARH